MYFLSPAANTASTEKSTEMLQQIQALVFLLTHLFSSSPSAPADFLFTGRKLTPYKIQIKEHILPQVCSTYGIAHG